MEIEKHTGSRPNHRRNTRAQITVTPNPANGDGVLLEPDFDEQRFLDYLAVLTPDFLVKNYPEVKLRNLCVSMRDALDRCAKRLQHLEQTRTALLCSHCGKQLPGGRFAGEIVIRNEITNELEALRAGCEPCYREISRMANERRAKHQGSVRGSVAF